MVKHWILLTALIVTHANSENITLISQARSSYLEKYKNYMDVVVTHFDIPEDVSFVSFQFRASEMQTSIFSCKAKEVQIYLKYGSLPVINPDNSKFPNGYILEGRSNSHHLHFLSDKTYKYVNLSDPNPGSYYAIAFHPYTDPKSEGIIQDGLTPKCYTYLDSSLYVKYHKNVVFVIPNKDIKAVIKKNYPEIFKIYVPVSVSHIVITFKDIKFSEMSTNLITSMRAKNNEEVHNYTIPLNDTESIKDTRAIFWVTDQNDYYFTFIVETQNDVEDNYILTKFIFELKFLYLNLDETSNNKNKDIIFSNAIPKIYNDGSFLLPLCYKQYDLHKSLSAESFLFTYEMQPLEDGFVPMSINVTNEGFAVVKYEVRDILDTGGNINLIMAFKPKIVRSGLYLRKVKESTNHTIVACIHNSEKAIPVWKEQCKFYGNFSDSPLILNSTYNNRSIIIPYPEAGDWYLTFKLFCNDCEPCHCPKSCKQNFNNCLEKCETLSKCVGICDSCVKNCTESLLLLEKCRGCDCDGDCLRTNKSCNTTVMFDISSYPCPGKDCGNNGKCAFLMSEGLMFSSCVCTNNYKGWDCSDDSQANSMAIVILELVLLVISNILFLPAAAVAYKRKYYVEMIVYASTCFFSSFYHACDAGENRISVCIMRLNVLQFCDFYCALLSIWVTLIALAHLKRPRPEMLHIIGTIIIATGTTVDKTSIWVFLLPVTVGVIIIICSWGFRYYQTRTIFPSKRYLKIYLPIGLATVCVALLLFSFLQTKNNYKYIHSLWHLMMAASVIILLPNMETFLPNSEYL